MARLLMPVLDMVTVTGDPRSSWVTFVRWNAQFIATLLPPLLAATTLMIAVAMPVPYQVPLQYPFDEFSGTSVVVFSAVGIGNVDAETGCTTDTASPVTNATDASRPAMVSQLTSIPPLIWNRYLRK